MNIKYNYSKENLEKLAKESWCESDMCQKLTSRWSTSYTLRKYIKQYQIDTSHWRKILPKCELDEYQNPKTNLQKQILELRKQNKSYKEIQKILNCAKSTISYILRAKTREDVYRRDLENYSDWERKLRKNTSRFLHSTPYNYIRVISKDWNMKLRSSTSKFKLRMGKNNKHFGR